MRDENFTSHLSHLTIGFLIKRIIPFYNFLIIKFVAPLLKFAVQIFMMKDEIFNKVVELIASNNHISPDTITIDSSFEDLSMDSLDGLTLINDLENEYNITLPNEEAVKIKTVRQAVDSLNKFISEK